MESSRGRQGVLNAILISIQTTKDSEQEIIRSQSELSALLLDLQITVKQRFIQKRSERMASTYLGSGKLKEIAQLTGGSGIVATGPGEPPIITGGDLLVVVDDELSPNQHRNLQTALGVEILDRVSVILKIFEKRAQTKEAKLQVELAKLEHQLPRIRDNHSLGDKEGGGGRASRGHSNVELAKQRIRKKMAELRREIDACLSNPTMRHDSFQVALVGYTNAGKSSIMRGLTRSDVYIEDKLFATLGTTTRALHPPAYPDILITDTVGFISRLPHQLIASFRSTLNEARTAGLILHVVDSADPEWPEQVKVTDKVLNELSLHKTPSWYVFNKADMIDMNRKQEIENIFQGAIILSAFDKSDLDRLRKKLMEYRSATLHELTFTLPYEKVHVFEEFRNQVEIMSEEYGDYVNFKIRSTKEIISKLKGKLHCLP